MPRVPCVLTCQEALEVWLILRCARCPARQGPGGEQAEGWGQGQHSQRGACPELSALGKDEHMPLPDPSPSSGTLPAVVPLGFSLPPLVHSV